MAKPDFGKMIGPLPLGAWLAVIGGGLAIAYYSRRSGGSTADDPVLSDPTTDVGAGGSGQWVNVDPPSNSAGNTSDPTTNDEWGVKAIRQLIGLGYPAAQADQAIRRYIATEGLAISEVVMVGAAIAAIGPTPIPLPPPTVGVPTSPPTNPPPTPRPPSKPYTYHTVRITENLPIIAIKYRKSIVDLWNANKKGILRLDGSKGILSSYALHSGQVLVIPWVTPVFKGTDPAYKKALGINS